jgi:HD-GYP domain-containing protein (c-di-GMP phosphodiesterase class II)
VIQDLAVVPEHATFHARALRDAGFRSSYTQPFYRDGTLAGFLFFDAVVADYFEEEVVRRLRVFAEELSSVVLHGLDVVRVLDAVLLTGAVLTRFRDHETAEHVERVSRSAWILGTAVASRWGLSDEVVEATALFAAAHDIGKVAIPESLISKHGPLDAEEFDQMKTHTTVGAEIVDGLVAELGIQDHAHLSILRNVVRSHHELLDGSGYPDGLRGDEIPAEARIVAVADVYDALRSERPYKPAWSPDEALAYLLPASGRLFEPECVEALRKSVKEIEEIRRRLDTG